MNILEDIKRILIKHKDKEHFLEIRLSWEGVTVYLEYDSTKEFSGREILPIRYSILDGVSYIPNDELKRKYNPNDLGIDLHEISLIKAIMEYFESHKQDIEKLCLGCDWEDREVDSK